MTHPGAPSPASQYLVAVTGHRHNNAHLQANLAAVETGLAELFDRIDSLHTAEAGTPAPVRLCNLLAEGIDQTTAHLALARGWQLDVVLPFGRALNAAINLHPASAAAARALLAGEAPGDPAEAERAQALAALLGRAQVFELAERDEEIAALYLAALDEPDSFARRRAFEMQANDRVTLAGRIMVERADLLVAVWDGQVANLPGGTGHTVVTALDIGTPVLLVDPARPAQWSLLTRPEEVAARPPHDPARLAALVAPARSSATEGLAALSGEENRHRGKSRLWGLYRAIEGGLGGAADAAAVVDHDPLAALRALPGGDVRQVDAIAGSIVPQFARADGVSTWLSDAYRSGMCLNFVLAALAVVIGAAYLPLGLPAAKWLFALAELLLLLLIVGVTMLGKRRDWHARWFETRRIAEYLRHAPIMLLLGCFRPAGKWPRSKGSDWPESHARQCLRAVGLPQIALSRGYLRAVLGGVLLPHVDDQCAYHRAKAARLRRVDQRLERLAELLFGFAIASVSLYLLLKAGAAMGVLPYGWPTAASPWLTFLGIALPTFGASIAGIRFFADFDRFSAISRVSADKFAAVSERIALLLAGPDSAIAFGPASALAHAVDEIVMEELENWQAIFSGKHIALPA